MDRNKAFMGYHRADGSVGVRNHLLVLSITGLTGPAARRIGRSIAGSRVVAMPFGSGIIGEDQVVHHRTLVGMGQNPNVGGVLVIGGHPPKVDQVAHDIGQVRKPVEALTLDECGHDGLILTDRGIRAAANMAREISRQRPEATPLSSLFLAAECGRSDPSSGFVSNPLIGRVMDQVIDAGGTAVFGETIEWLGAEHRLTSRAMDETVKQAIVEAVSRREQAAVEAGIDLMGVNPGPTNIEAGLSTIEEKALGSIAKGGSQPIHGVLGYAEAPSRAGLFVMDAPSYAPESLTGMIAAGATLILFSTGPGNSFVNSLAPTIKISANPETVKRLKEQIDFDASPVFLGHQDVASAGNDLSRLTLDVASGAATWGEILDEGEEVVSRMGPAL